MTVFLARVFSCTLLIRSISALVAVNFVHNCVEEPREAEYRSLEEASGTLWMDPTPIVRPFFFGATYKKSKNIIGSIEYVILIKNIYLSVYI